MHGLSKGNIPVRGCAPLGDNVEIHFSATIRVTEANGQKSKAFVRKEPSKPPPPERRVFLAQVPGEVWFIPQRGTPMIRRGSNARSWPTIVRNVEAKKRWIVLVVDGTGSEPLTPEVLEGAEYFDCPADRALPQSPNQSSLIRLVKEMEALQEIGRTGLGNGAIQDAAKQLRPQWNVSDSIIWNSQHYSLHLAASILTEGSYNVNRGVFITLSRDLHIAAHAAEAQWMVAKHVGCMAGMAVSGVVTFGLGAGVFWCGAATSMGKAMHVQFKLDLQLGRLRDSSERFQGWAWIWS